MGNNKLEIRKYKKDEIIFEEGTREACMYAVYSGTVGIYSNYGTSEEKLLTRLYSEEFFGEMGLIEEMPRSATAVALEKNTEVQVITADTFENYFKERPAKVFVIMQHMSQRLRKLTNDYMSACRTVSRAMEAEKDNGEKSGELKDDMKKFADVYNTSGKE